MRPCSHPLCQFLCALSKSPAERCVIHSRGRCLRTACLFQRRGHRGRRRRDFLRLLFRHVVDDFLYRLSYHRSLVLFLWNTNNCTRCALLLFAFRSVRSTTIILIKSPSCVSLLPLRARRKKKETRTTANAKRKKTALFSVKLLFYE